MEAPVHINGVLLSNAQVLSTRVAISGMITDLVNEPDRLGTDEHGRAMHALYLIHLREVEAMLISGREAMRLSGGKA